MTLYSQSDVTVRLPTVESGSIGFVQYEPGNGRPCDEACESASCRSLPLKTTCIRHKDYIFQFHTKLITACSSGRTGQSWFMSSNDGIFVVTHRLLARHREFQGNDNQRQCNDACASEFQLAN